jgi:WD40 repeat protein
MSEPQSHKSKEKRQRSPMAAILSFVWLSTFVSLSLSFLSLRMNSRNRPGSGIKSPTSEPIVAEDRVLIDRPPSPNGQLQPASKNPVVPRKVLSNVAQFDMMRLADGGKTIVTGQPGNNGTYNLNFFDIATGTQQKNRSFTLSGLPDQSKLDGSSTFSVQGNILAFSAYLTQTPAQIWNLKTQQQLALPNELAKQFLLPSFDGQFVFLKDKQKSGLARVLPTGETTPLISLEGDPIIDFGGYSPDGSIVVAPGGSGQPLRGWSTQTGKVVRQFEMPKMSQPVIQLGLIRVSQAQDRQLVVSAAQQGANGKQFNSFYVWGMWPDGRTQFQIMIGGFQERIGDLAISPDAQTLAVQTGKTLQIRDLTDGSLLRRIPLNSPASIQFTDDGKTLVVGTVGPASPGISLWDVQQLRSPDR